MRWSVGWLFLLTLSAAPPEYVRQDVMIPMRDGVRLFTTIHSPKGQAEPLPFILLRTPYSVETRSPLAGQYMEDLAQEGYIFVFQDIRGKFKSEGKFVMQRPLRNPADPKSIDEGSDTWDTFEWLAKNVANHNGRAGMLGVSYDGWLTIMGQLDPHPLLKATSPQASPADMFMGDDFHHNGAFRLSYGFEYAAMMETANDNQQFQFKNRDTYEWYWKLGPLANVNRDYLHGKIPTWNNFASHPNYDSFWQQQAVGPMLKKTTVPTLNVAGWWDQEDFYGPLEIYRILEKQDTDHKNFLVVGPWNHGGWSRSAGDSLGRIEFGSKTAEYFREKIQAPWFAYHLKGKGTLEFPEANLFETGTNRWKSYDEWPPKEPSKALYLGADGLATFEGPDDAARRQFMSYLSDPAHPVPYRMRPVEATYGPGSRWGAWLVEDQRFVHRRPDVASWQTNPLNEELTVSGEIVAKLVASTTGTDADWIVKLIDVYPDEDPSSPGMSGYQLMVANEVLRGRFRKSFEKPEPIAPNVAESYTVPMRWANHTFRKGHRIMVQVQSTWFPLIDRNPQKYVPNIFEARPADFRKATQRIFGSSRLELPVQP